MMKEHSLMPMKRSGHWKKVSIVLASSGGGHFDMLMAASAAIPEERHWVTVDGPRSQSLRASGERVYTVPTLDSDHLNLSNPFRSILLALRLRPRLVVTTGAGVVSTFALVSWLLGARLVFVETMARVNTPSKAGAVLSRLASLHVVQWPELVGHSPRAKLCRPALLPESVDLRQDGVGTFVSLGTHPAPFDRLLRMVDAALEEGLLPAPCLVQGLSDFRSPRMHIEPTISPQEFQSTLENSRYVVGHAGAGFVSSALAHGHRPMVLPRLAAHDEHVDDHQLELVRKLAGLGLIVNAEAGFTPLTMAAVDASLDYDGVFEGLPTVTQLIASYLASGA